MSYRGSICALPLVAALLATPSAAQVVDFGKYPDLKGQWVRPPGSPNNWLLQKSRGVSNLIHTRTCDRISLTDTGRPLVSPRLRRLGLRPICSGGL